MRSKKVVICAIACLPVLFGPHPVDVRSQTLDLSNAHATPPAAPVRPVTEIHYGNNWQFGVAGFQPGL